MFPVGIEPTISAGERPQTYALDRAATGTGMEGYVLKLNGGRLGKETFDMTRRRQLHNKNFTNITVLKIIL